jgi:hypothetical protein
MEIDNKLFDLETCNLRIEVLPEKKLVCIFDKQNFMKEGKLNPFQNYSSNNHIEQHTISVSGKIMFIHGPMVMFCYLNLIHVILVKRIGANHSLII